MLRRYNIINYTIEDEAKEWVGFIKEPLQELYKNNKGMRDRDFMLEIERAFGNDLLTKVCIPYNLDRGACLFIAMKVAKEG